MRYLEHDMKRARQCLNPFSQMMNGFDGEFFIRFNLTQFFDFM